MRFPLHCGVLLVLCICPLMAAGTEIVIPETTLVLTIPDDFTRATLQNAPNILLQCDAPKGDATMQVFKGLPAESATGMATAYETRIRQAFATWKQAEERTVTLLERPTLVRRYTATGDGLTLDVQAAFCTQTTPPLVIHAISQGKGQLSRMAEVLASLRQLPPPSPVAVPATRHTILPPMQWQVDVDQTLKSVKLSSPDASMLLAISAMAVEMGEMTPAQLADVTATELEANLPKGGGWKRVEDRRVTPAGAVMRLRRYTGKVDGTPMEIGLIARVQDAHVFALYGNMIPAQRERIWLQFQAVADSVTRIETPKPPAVGQTLPGGWRLRGSGPVGWTRNADQTQATFLGSGDAKDVRITVQRFPLEGVHATLAASEAEALRQLRITPTARLLQQDVGTIADAPARVLECSYSVDAQTRRMLQVLVGTEDYLFWIGFDGPVAAYDAHLDTFRTFVKELTIVPLPKTPTPQPPADGVTHPAGAGIQFTLPTGWQATKEDTLHRYTPPAEARWPGAEVTVRLLPRTTAIPNAQAAARKLREGFPRNVVALNLLNGEVRGMPYSLTEYRTSAETTFLHRRLYYLDLANGIGEVSCQLTTTNLHERDRLWTLVKPSFDRVFETLAPAQ